MRPVWHFVYSLMYSPPPPPLLGAEVTVHCAGRSGFRLLWGDWQPNLHCVVCQDAIEKAQKIAGVSGPINTNTNMAFVFIKPHAMKPAAIDLAKEMLTGAGIELGDSDVLDNKTIEEKVGKLGLRWRQ